MNKRKISTTRKLAELLATGEYRVLRTDWVDIRLVEKIDDTSVFFTVSPSIVGKLANTTDNPTVKETLRIIRKKVYGS